MITILTIILVRPDVRQLTVILSIMITILLVTIILVRPDVKIKTTTNS